MLARLFVFFGGLFVLALVAALVGPYFVDWTSYRADFEREASAVLGRPVKVEGSANARLLPFPSVTFSDVTVAGQDARPAMTVKTFSMDAELAPLLHGEFLIFDMRLVEPEVAVEVAADGTVDWALRPAASFDPSRIALENLRIIDGRVVLRHGAGAREHVVSDLDATLSARSLAGPWRGEGTMSLDGARVAVSGSSGLAESGAMRLKLDVAPAETPFRLALEGDVHLLDGAADYSGSFRIAQPAPAGGEAAGETGRSGRRPDPGMRLSGAFALDHRRLSVNRFRFETGPRDDPYVAEGKASVDLGAAPRFTVEARGDQFRLDEPAAGEEAPAAISFAQRISALERSARALPRPAIPGTVTLDLPAVVAGDTTVRDLRLSAEPAPGGWRIAALSAALPGRTTLEASGLLATEGELLFEGSLLVAVAQPSGFATWLASDVGEAVRRLPAAGFSAHALLSAERQSFTGLELVLGEARLRGSMENSAAGARPSLALRLEGERLDLDQLDAFASLFTGGDGGALLAGRDVALSLKAGPVSAGGVSAAKLDADALLRGDALEIRRLVVDDLAGARVTASGALAGRDAGRAGSLKLEADAADLRPLIELAAARFPAVPGLSKLAARAQRFPKLLADSHVEIAAKAAEGGALSGSATGTFGGSRLQATFGAKGEAGDLAGMDLSLDAKLANADGAPLLALLGLPAEPAGLTGAAELSLTLAGTPAAGGLAMRTALTGGHFSAGFTGTVAAAGGGLSLKGPVTLEAGDIEPWMLTIGAALPGFGLGTPATLAAEADYADGLLVLSAIRGNLDEEAVGGDVNVAVRAGVPDVTGALTLDSFDLARAASVVLGATALDEAPGGAPATPFRETALPPFTAALGISAGVVDAGALGTLYDADFTLSLDAERLALSGLAASLHDGTLKGNVELKNSGGAGFLSAQLDLRDAVIATAFGGGGLQAQGDFSGSVSAAGKSIQGLIASLGGSGTAALRDLHVAGISAKALPAILAEADAAKRGPDGNVAAGFAPALAADGAFFAERADIAFTLAGGMLRAPPVALANPDATLTADLRADLNAGTVTAKGRITYAAKDDALVGSAPALDYLLDGPLQTAHLAIDPAPLAQFLTQRALEREQARVEAMQEELLERQRLRRESRYYAGLETARRRAAAERDRQAQAVQIRVDDRAALEVGAARRAAEQQEELRRAAEAMRIAEAERASRATRSASPPPPLPADRPADAFINLEFDPARNTQ